jgi:hypothetical protein
MERPQTRYVDVGGAEGALADLDGQTEQVEIASGEREDLRV